MKRNYHFRRIPHYIEQELRSLKSQHVIVAAVIILPLSDIRRGAFRHLGIKFFDGRLVVPEVLYPENLHGTYANRNRNGIIWIQNSIAVIVASASSYRSLLFILFYSLKIYHYDSLQHH